MKVVIDARIEPGLAGGVAIAVKSLLVGLGELTDGNEEYVVIADGEEQAQWFGSFLSANQRLVMWPRPTHTWSQRQVLKVMRPVANYLRRVIDRRAWPEVPISDGLHESLGGDVLHIPTQNFVLCAMPTIYNPHDLQHLRYPQFFRPDVLARREVVYPAGCHLSQVVVVGSNWIKRDIIRRYHTDPDKIQVVLEAAPTQASVAPSQADLARVRAATGLTVPFLLYPGVTWPHKNHLRLFEALAQLRDQRGLDIGLICTGTRYPRFWPEVERGMQRYGLTERVRFLGHVPEIDLRALYQMATCLVLPSLYEASSLPIFEAWLDKLPVLCSNATALPEQVRDAALVFDPTDVDAMATAIASAMTDPTLRESLRARGTNRLGDFDASTTARTYRALYRRTAGLPLSEQDAHLLRPSSGDPTPAR